MRDLADRSTDSRFLTSKEVKDRFGGISDMTLRRWTKDTRVNFPAPVMIRGRKFYREDQLDAWSAENLQSPTQKRS